MAVMTATDDTVVGADVEIVTSAIVTSLARTAIRGVNGQESVWASSVLVGRASGVVASRGQQ